MLWNISSSTLLWMCLGRLWKVLGTFLRQTIPFVYLDYTMPYEIRMITIEDGELQI